MRTDSPAVAHWLDETAVRCAYTVGLFSDTEIALLREVLAKALEKYPQSALNAELLTDLRTGFARLRRESMSPEAWAVWRQALQLHLRLVFLGACAVEPAFASERANWLCASKEWFEMASGASLNQPVRLLREHGRPRDMVVTHVEVMCSAQDIEGYAVLTARVYRPPRTSSCQLFVPGDQLQKLAWSDLPAGAEQEGSPDSPQGH
jgi:hypothetical protein